MSVNHDFIRRVALFEDLPTEHLDALIADLREMALPSGAIIFREGDRGDRFYIVADGRVGVVKAMGSADERTLAVNKAGEFVGEMSLLNADGLRTASAVVLDDARLLMLTREQFDALLHRYPPLAYAMLRVMSERLSDTNEATLRDLREKNHQLATAYAELKAAQPMLIEQQRLARELELAAQIQASMLPQRLPTLDGFDLCALMLPAHQIGGDFYDVFALDENTIALATGDVSGKGVPAALFMALVSSLLRAEAQRGQAPADVAAQVNRQLLQRNPLGMFATLVYATLDVRTRRLSYVRAGHPWPLMWDRGGHALPLAEQLSNPLGMFDVPMLDAREIELRPGDSILFYSDGVSEAMSPYEEQFGEQRLREAMLRGAHASPEQSCANVVSDVQRYRETEPQSDDITLLLLRARSA